MCSSFPIESYRFQAHLPVFGLHGEIDVGRFEVRTVELTPPKGGTAVVIANELWPESNAVVGLSPPPPEDWRVTGMAVVIKMDGVLVVIFDIGVLVVTKVLTAGGCIWNHNMN